MKNRKLNFAAILFAALGIVITWCAKYALYFFRGDMALNFLPLLLVNAALLLLFLIMWKKQLPKWVTVVSLVILAISFLIPLIFTVVNILNFPHFLNNLHTILPEIVVGAGLMLVYMYYDKLVKSRKAQITAIVLTAAVIVSASCTTLACYLTSGTVVFDTGDVYTVEFISNRNGLGFVEVSRDGRTETYYHTEHGKRVAHTTIHQIEIPKEKLQGATYRAGVKSVLFTVSNQTFFGNTTYGQSIHFKSPANDEGATFFTVSDVHTQPKGAVKAIEKHFDELDFIVCLGDMVSFSGNHYDLTMLVDSMARLSKGALPVVFTRGNHELMGEGANAIEDYIPTPTGQFYYTFTYNNAYFIVNDMGADKPDDNRGFSGLSDGVNYRLSQHDFFEDAIQNASGDYVIHLSHIPISTESEPLKSNLEGIIQMLSGKIDLSIAGHTHRFLVEEPSDRVPFTVIQEGGNIGKFPDSYIGAIFTLRGGHITVDQVDASGNILDTIPLK